MLDRKLRLTKLSNILTFELAPFQNRTRIALFICLAGWWLYCAVAAFDTLQTLAVDARHVRISMPPNSSLPILSLKLFTGGCLAALLHAAESPNLTWQLPALLSIDGYEIALNSSAACSPSPSSSLFSLESTASDWSAAQLIVSIV